MRNSYHVFLAVILSITSYAAAYGEEIRDYYAEPGLNPFKETLNQDLNEHIDPFSGTLQHKYVDMHIPGNGGLDLKVSRVYTSPQEALGVRTVTGAGWTMHFGRVVIPTDYTDTLCLQDLYAVSTKDNPSIEFPDGGRELLVLDAVHGTYLITKSGWRAMCNGSGQGLIVTSPTGTVYTMDALNTLNNHWSWYTTNIRDRHGNTIDVTYKTNSSHFIYLDTVTASDGRQVKFDYLDEESASIRLNKITANEQTWTYRYEPIEAIGPGYGDNYHNLTEVIRPDGLRWRYSYYPYTSLDTAGNYALKTVTYPYGANITYTYQHIDFTPTDLSIDRTTAIATKNVSGPPGISVGPGSSLPSGTWRFEFEPHSPELFFTDKGTWTSGLDKTTVRMPGGKQVYYHYGYSYTGGLSSGILWATGLLYKQETRDGCSADSCAIVGSTLVDEVTNGWEPRLISHENFWHGREGLDEDTYVPQLRTKVHNRVDSGNKTRNEQYDAFGNAGRMIESSNLAGDPDKITELGYYIDREKWILHQVEDETIIGTNGEVVSHIDRTFNEDGELIAADQNGVLTSYTYTAEGDLATATDARGSTARYASYHRGIAQIEEHPESVTLARVVNDTGTVASQTNGRGFTRHFTYDAMNRLTGITYPLNAPVSAAWDASGKTLTRGSYEERITLDGFGRVVSTTRADTALGINITQTLAYDVHSNKIFESYPNSEAGVSYAYDILKRLSTLQHPDGALRSYVYGGREVTETDERGNTTNYLYRSFGDPDKDKVLVQISGPNNLYTILDYNLLNLPTEVFQGELNPSDGSISGYSRRLSYDSRYFLTSVSDPETGVTSYGRDEVGNMISRQVGSSGVTAYTYDTLNRQVFSDYPGTTPDVTKSYDADGHLTKLTNSQGVNDYRYDENDNLIEQVLTLDGVPYRLSYTLNVLDGPATLTYPSGRVVDYLPDALGRPTQVAPYVDSVRYHPGGQLAQINHANGQVTDIALNERQWMSEFLHQGLAELHYAYDALGNVLGLSDRLNPAEDRAFGYDALNRLTSAQGRWGAGSFEYDTFGNLTLMALGVDSHVLDYNGLRLRSVVHNNATRSWYAHDTYGNVRSDTKMAGTNVSGSLIKDQHYVYDDAGHLRSVPVQEYVGGIQSFSTHHFDYDAAGDRVRRTTPTGRVTDFVYGRTGQLLGEYLGPARYGKEYIYLGSQIIASAITNEPPVADAGPDRVVDGGKEVTLDGRGSADPDGSISVYAWRQTAGPAVDLSSPAGATTRFTAPRLPAEVRLRFDLTVTDRAGESAADEVQVLVRPPPNSVPIANAGPDRIVKGGTLVILDGTASSDADGSITAYGWQQTVGTPVTLAGADRATASFSSPPVNSEETLTFTLTVTDDRGASATNSVEVTLLPNAAPTAAAGSDQTVSRGSVVSLDGSGSQDSDGQIMSAVWHQEGGTPVILTGADSAIASFSAPRPAAEEPLRFSLTVTDDSGASASDAVTIIVLANQPPLADAGLDQSITAGSLVDLHGEGSSDPEGGPLHYRWQQTEGAAVSLTDGDTATPSFTAPSPAADEMLGFTLTVTDDEGEEASDIVRVEVRAAGITRGPTTRISLASDGTQANNASYDLAISADGRYVAFNSGASNLVSGDTNDTDDVFVHDRQTGESIRVSVATDVTQANDGSYALALSADGRYVAFSSGASNLVRDDTNELFDIFVHDRETGTTTRVSVATGGTQGNGWSNEPALSADGRYVAFHSNARNLVTGDTNDATDIFVHDRETGTTTRVSVTSNGAQGHDYSEAPAISADGRYVVFSSTANNLVIGDTHTAPDSPDIFVHDRQTGRTTLVSVASSGTQANAESYWPAISADGRYVAFYSEADNLVSGDSNNALDIFVHDRQTATTIRVSAARDGTQGDGHSGFPGLSADGRFVAFYSEADNLTEVDPNGAFSDGFVHDRQTGTTRRVSVASDGSAANKQSSVPYRSAPALSADGRYVAFYSEADNLVSGDSNNALDIFVHDRQTATTIRVSAARDGTQGDGHSGFPGLSADGRFVAFYSEADNLTEVDPNGAFSDGFVHDRQTGTTRRVSVASDGSAANKQSSVPYRSAPALSADGRYVAFYSEADNLVSGDTNQASDIFVHERIDTEANKAPRASAGLDRSVTGGTTVTLDGRGSQDLEGGSLNYRWTQIQGPRVSIKNPSTARPRLTAPYVAAPTGFELTLTVTDDHGATASDSVLITVEPRSNPRDTRPPRTGYSQSGTTIGGLPGYRITLRPNETASVYFRVTGVGILTSGGIPTSDWQIYSSRLTLVMHTPGEATLEYYAIDKAGNVETTQRKILRRTQ